MVKIYKIETVDDALSIALMLADKNWKQLHVSKFGDYGQLDTDFATWYTRSHFGIVDLIDLLRSNLLGIELKSVCFLGKKGEEVRLKI